LKVSTDNLSQLPNLIFIDGVPSKLLGGISQTLYNLFDGYPANKLYTICDQKQLTEITDASLKTTIIKLAYTSIEFKYRPFNYLNSFLKYLDLSFRELFIVKYFSKKELPNTGLIFLCTSNIDKLQLAKKVFQSGQYKLVAYYMDDWMADTQYNWLNGSLQEYVKWSLDIAVGNIMISEQLTQILHNRYNLTNKPTIILHNPVDLRDSSTTINSKQFDHNVTFKIGYAGSIWPMHKDAVVKVAQAVGNINKGTSQNICFDIYSKSFFWDINNEDLNHSGTAYKGFLNYDDLFDTIHQYDLLVVASSFLKEHENFSKSSVQTKITDYLNAQVAILSVGPANGASNLFIRKWDCGFVWDENNAFSLEEFILQIISNTALRNKQVENGINILRENFSKQIIQTKLYNFLHQFN
jgi:glycosyltransferase involved in cell wall biosynthesis